MVTVGMPRAGSTLQMKMIFKLLGEKFTEEKVKKAYWDLFKHVVMEPKKMEAHIQFHHKFLSTLPEDVVFVTKTHEYKPQLAKLCKRTVIVSIRRNLTETASSMLTAKWMGPQSLGSFLEASINRHRCWNRHEETIDVDYAKLVQDPLTFMRRFVISSAIDVPDSLVQNVVAQVAAEEANPDIPGGTALDITELDTAMRTITNFSIVSNFQRKFGYQVL
uniref:Sulfotransferase domain-containing protein n=1 Tax=Compsopogon caeruleus TaxID=31354 RepID=A0A7S1THW3_9RHOD